MAITIPNTFVAGTKIEAAPVNANFAEVANAVDKRGDTLTGNLSANAGVTVDGVDLSTIPNTAGTFNPLFPQVVIGSADTNGIRLDLESGTLAVREGDDSAYGPLTSGLLTTSGNHVPATNDGGALGTTSLSWADLFLATGGVINFASGDVTLTHSTNTLTFAGAASGYIFNDGNVGIGTSSPSARLHVNGVAGSTTAFFNQANTGKTGIILAENGVARGYLSQVGLYAGNSDGNFGIFVETGYNFQIATNGSATSKFTVTTGGNIAIGATARLYLDGVAGTGDTYLEEVTANEVRIVAAGNERLRAVGSNGIKITGALTVPSGTPIYLDGSFTGDTYLYEQTGNRPALVVAGVERFAVAAAGVESYGSEGLGYFANGTGTSTGTAVVHATNGYLYRQSSSRRFKENISTAVVTDTQLDAFMATAPSWWDYTGQKNGALGFIAEDLAALPMERYGFNPLVNYDGDGQIESNRDYALIAMHHLVIQRLERKIAALEARIH